MSKNNSNEQNRENIKLSDKEKALIFELTDQLFEKLVEKMEKFQLVSKLGVNGMTTTIQKKDED